MATLVQQAITSLPRFGQSYKKFFDKLVTLQYSMNTINGYQKHLFVTREKPTEYKYEGDKHEVLRK